MTDESKELFNRFSALKYARVSPGEILKILSPFDRGILLVICRGY